MSVIISPNMSLPVPVVSVEPGPNWAQDVNSCMSVIDGHNHSPGSGVQLTSNAFNINADLPFNNNNAITLKSIRFSPQSSPLATPADVGCLYESGVDLYYNDGAGNQVRITQSGSVTGSAGTITGLPSGTASASYAAGTFSFRSATNTPANFELGPIILGRNAALSKTITFSPDAAQAANYNLTFPAAAPANGQLLVSDGSGNFLWSTQAVGNIPVGSVIATFPNLTGAYTTAATTVADSSGFVLCQGQVIADGTSPMNGQTVPNISNNNFLKGSTVSGSTGGTSTHDHVFSHTHAFANRTTTTEYWRNSSDSSSTSVSSSNREIMSDANIGAGGVQGFINELYASGIGNESYYTAGAVSAPSGSGSTATTSTVGTIPPFISAVYLMRIK